MKLLLSLLKKNISVLIASTLAIAAVLGVYALMGREIVWYAFFLALCLCLIVAVLRFVGFVRRHNQLKDVLANAGFDISNLPDPADAIEGDYQRIIQRMSRELKQKGDKYDSGLRDLADYYTLWAHQIKTPIAAMRLLLKPGDDALGQELFKIERYVEMALGIARMQSDASDYVIRRQPLDPIIRKAIRKYARLFIGKKLALEYAGCDEVINTDEKWFGFALEQLISNAIKYTERGKIIITATGSSLTVADTGIGIAPESLPRVFEKGFTGYTGRADEKSTGLGLYMAKTALDRLGHSISITSEPGRGTSVTIGFDGEERIFE